MFLGTLTCLIDVRHHTWYLVSKQYYVHRLLEQLKSHYYDQFCNWPNRFVGYIHALPTRPLCHVADVTQREEGTGHPYLL